MATTYITVNKTNNICVIRFSNPHTHTIGERTHATQTVSKSDEPTESMDQKEHCVFCVVEFIYYLRPVVEFVARELHT